MDSDLFHALEKAEVNNAPKREYLTIVAQAEKYLQSWGAQSESRLIYIESGALFLESNLINSLVPAKHAMWIPANREIRLESSSSEIKLYILNFDNNQELDEEIAETKVFPIQSLGQELILKLGEWNLVSKNLTELEKASLHVIKLLIPQWAQAQAPILLPTTNHPKLNPALQYIRENIQSHVVLGDVANICSMSKRTLTRLFQQELGISFSTYVRLVRVTLALEMFNKSGINVSSVAFDVGYESITAFSNTFRLFVGVRPQEYLKNLLRS